MEERRRREKEWSIRGQKVSDYSYRYTKNEGLHVFHPKERKMQESRGLSKNKNQVTRKRGLLETDLVTLNHGQITRTTPELVTLVPNNHTTPTGERVVLMSPYKATRGLLATYLVILKLVQATRTTPELAPHLP
ncbi:hypothetical protein TNCV_3057831 [Trichonephila clavipes]|nr:hypothetical protein TNCV_3057831 [Trichonephila clavipes]